MKQPYHFNPHQGPVIVSVKIFGPSGISLARFALDTGATRTLIGAGLLSTIGYDPALAPDRFQITTGSSVEYVPRLLVSKIQALGETRIDFPVLAHTLPPSANIDGLLGLDFLRGRILNIDFSKGTIDLQ